jgi:hypothetical protein
MWCHPSVIPAIQETVVRGSSPEPSPENLSEKKKKLKTKGWECGSSVEALSSIPKTPKKKKITRCYS